MITIYTDGSCLTNPGNGGWAAIINDEKEIRKISGSEKNTTNNRMQKDTGGESVVTQPVWTQFLPFDA